MIKLYTKTVCPKCIVAKAMLSDSEIEFTEVNVESNDEAREKLLDLGYSSAPIVEHDGNYYTNEQLLGLIQDIK